MTNQTIGMIIAAVVVLFIIFDAVYCFKSDQLAKNEDDEDED